MRKWIILIAIVFTLYSLSYVIFRQSNSQIWEKDGKEYVIFPTNKVYMYYLYRPLNYVDGNLTGMRFHIGEHQNNL